MRTLTGRWRWVAVASVGVVCLAAAAAAVAAAAGGGSAATYTGCLSTQGVISKLQKGSKPIGTTCPTGTVSIKLSSGDVTGVTAGTGLAGGATGGNATLGLAHGYSLPQGCGDGTYASANGSGGWGCAANPNTAFSYGSVAPTQTVFAAAGSLQVELTCNPTKQTGDFEVINLSNSVGNFNFFEGAVNASTSADIGFTLGADAQKQAASTTGSTGSFVWNDSLGSVVTGTVTWFYDTGTGTCQFHGMLTSATTS